MMAQKPLLLKDYLELDPNSDSCNSFASFPRRADSFTVRFLLEAERCRSGGGARLIRSPSKGTLTRISAVINAVKNFPISSPTRPGGFSKRLISIRFWKKKKGDDDSKVTVKDIVRLNSFELYGAQRRSSLYFPSPVVSSCSSCSDADEGSDSFLSSSSGGSSECFAVKSSPSPSHRQPTARAGEQQEIEHRECQSAEEKEQLSPVSVMDFPYQEDEGNEVMDFPYQEDEGNEDDEGEDDEVDSPCFEQSLANIERTTHQLLQKIRRFETLAELDPIDLELRISSHEGEESEDGHVATSDERTAWDLIQRLRTNCPVGPHSEGLLADFFVEGLSWFTSPTSADAESLLSAARRWIKDEGCLNAEEHGKAQLSEMERNGRWRGFEDGRHDVASDVESRVLRSLLHELVLDLVEMD